MVNRILFYTRKPCTTKTTQIYIYIFKRHWYIYTPVGQGSNIPFSTIWNGYPNCKRLIVLLHLPIPVSKRAYKLKKGVVISFDRWALFFLKKSPSRTNSFCKTLGMLFHFHVLHSYIWNNPYVLFPQVSPL